MVLRKSAPRSIGSSLGRVSSMGGMKSANGRATYQSAVEAQRRAGQRLSNASSRVTMGGYGNTRGQQELYHARNAYNKATKTVKSLSKYK